MNYCMFVLGFLLIVAGVVIVTIKNKNQQNNLKLIDAVSVTRNKIQLLKKYLEIMSSLVSVDEEYNKFSKENIGILDELKASIDILKMYNNDKVTKAGERLYELAEKIKRDIYVNSVVCHTEFTRKEDFENKNKSKLFIAKFDKNFEPIEKQMTLLISLIS